MRRDESPNIDAIELKSIKEKNNDFDEIPDLNPYFQTRDLKDLTSLDDNFSREINNNDMLYGNNYIKYFMKNKILQNNSGYKDRPKKFGNLFTYLFIGNYPLLAIGIEKLSLVIIYQFFLHLSFILIHISIIQSVFPYMRYLLTLFYLINFLNHAYLCLFNPGIPNIECFSKNCLKKIKKEDKKYFQICEICNIIVDSSDDVRHCNECNICVKNWDHHCYWTGKCIAKNNYYSFQIFTFTILLYYLWYAIIFVVWALIQISNAKYHKQKVIVR